MIFNNHIYIDESFKFQDKKQAKTNLGNPIPQYIRPLSKLRLSLLSLSDKN